MLRHVLLVLGLCCSLSGGRAGAGNDREFTLVVDGRQVMGVGPDGRPAWKFRAGDVVCDGQTLGKDRVLLALGGPGMIVEMDLAGKRVPVRHAAAVVRSVQRLPGGVTFFAEGTRVVEVDRDGKETVLHRRVREGGVGIHEVMSARKLADGGLAVLTSDAVFRLLDAKGKELKSFGVGKQGDFVGPGRLAVPPDGGVVVSKGGPAGS